MEDGVAPATDAPGAPVAAEVPPEAPSGSSQGQGSGAGEHARRALDYGWMPLLALAATQFLEAGERQALAQAISGIQGEFVVSDLAIGALFTAMAILGGLGSIPIGILADRIRRTWLLAGAMTIWTLAIGASGLAGGFVMLFAARGLLGAVEANSPAAMSLISDYYPVRTRARMMGLYQSGALLGALVGLLGGGIAVQLGGWRWAAFMWVPFGAVTVLWLLRTPEPVRGDQDRDFEADITRAGTDVAGITGVADAHLSLPAPRRVGSLDYGHVTWRELLREFLQIRTMWVAILGLGISQLLLQGLQAWGIEYFKRVHELDAVAAGGVAAALGLGSAIGIVGGGFLADRYFRRGVAASRVYVAAFSSIAATVFLLPAFASDSLAVTAPLLVVGGICMTLPVAPAEAMLNDVIVPQLRGRAATVRAVVRSSAAVGPLLIGALSSAFGLQRALVLLTPLPLVGGLLILLAVRHYPYELAFVVAESRRQAERVAGPDDDAPTPDTEDDA